MIDKSVNYNDKDFSKHLKGLGLSKEEISYILGETKRKKFEGGGDGGSGGDGSSGDGSSGDGSSGEGDSSAGDSGPGGSDDGSGHGGPGGSDSGPGGSDDGTGHGGPGPGDSGPGVGDTFGSSTADDAASNQAASEAAAQAASDEATIGMQTDPTVTETGVMSTIAGFARDAITNAINNPLSTIAGIALGPVGGLAAKGIAAAVDAANRGVTGRNDASQAQTSVQSGPSQSPSDGGGISTIQEYAPIYNPDTGNPTMDAYMRRLRVNLGLPV
jgi:hypothetical protein